MHVRSRSLRPIALLLLAGGLVPAPAVVAVEPPPLVFEGLGLAGFEGVHSVASALRGIEPPPGDRGLLEFRGLAVNGPGGRDPAPGPLAAELRSRVDRIDVAAGLLADPSVIDAGPSRWTGRIGLSTERPSGGESLELRTMLGHSADRSLVGVEVGPRVERRLPRGVTFFIDGKAEAQAVRPAATGWWSLPGSTDGLSLLGVTARTGIVR